MTNASHRPAGPKLLDGREPAAFLQARHIRTVAGLPHPPRLAIVRSTANPAGDQYLRMKRKYGLEIGAEVDLYADPDDQLIDRIGRLNADPAVTGILVQLPLGDRSLTDRVLAAVDPAKDIDGLGPHSEYEPGTVKAALWLLAAHNVPVAGRIVIVGQGRLVGKPLADRLEAAGHEVVRADINTNDLGAVTRTADMIFTGTGRHGLLKADMVKSGAVIIDTGAPSSELDPELFERPGLTITPNPGGVGPMTVACLFDNLLIAAQRHQPRGPHTRRPRRHSQEPRRG
jgi:methylenetetrahydrofolate dehydrogenase (NADP+)/methenyltetrahydrofolate cyclohydrolase